MAIPLFNGLAVLGVAVHSQLHSEPPAVQKDSFFGVPGVLAISGGGRGRTWSLSGVIFGVNIGICIAGQIALASLVESATPGVFTDTQGNPWPNCFLESGPTWNATGPFITDNGWIYPYQGLTIRALS